MFFIFFCLGFKCIFILSLIIVKNGIINVRERKFWWREWKGVDGRIKEICGGVEVVVLGERRY